MDRIAEALDLVRRAKALGGYDSNVIGMAGEIVAEERFGLVCTKCGNKDIDGFMVVNGDKRSVQVKAMVQFEITEMPRRQKINNPNRQHC